MPAPDDAGGRAAPEDRPPWLLTPFALRFCDTDALGHVNNAVYAQMLEAARCTLIARCGLLERMAELALVVVRIEIDFRSELVWPGDLVVATTVERIGGKSLTLRHEVWLADRLAAEGRSVCVMLDRSTRRSVALGDDLRARFATWMATPPA